MIRVLVVDDSVAVRGLVSALLGEDPEIQVVGVAPNGKLALAKYGQLHPDVVTLDVEMPEMDGLATLRAIRGLDSSATVIMFSSLTSRGAATTLDALAEGAADYVAKPESAHAGELIRALGSDLIAKVKLHARRKHAAPARPSAAVPPATLPSTAAPSVPRPARPAASLPRKRVDIVAIASSTGGPNALSAVIPALPEDLRTPVVIVQHMPELFTKLLAERLDSLGKIRVCEGAAGDVLQAGAVYIAPGGHHMETVRSADHVQLRLHDHPPENSCRPAADVLFRSVARCYGGHVLAVVLTGMGQDGLNGCEVLRQAGAQVIAQDQASSVVWGMPRAVADAGLADLVLPLEAISEAIVRRVQGHA